MVDCPGCIWIDKTTKPRPIFREADIDPNPKAQRDGFVVRSQMKNLPVKLGLHQNFNLGAI